MKPVEVEVHDALQDYSYERTEPIGKNFDPAFRPDLAPAEMLALGVFGGAYFADGSVDEFPKAWFKEAKLADAYDKRLNHFGVRASQSRAEWARKGWLSKEDPLGWFQWYCRYYLGRRLPKEDARQIDRWRKMVRHVAQVKYGCRAGDATCRPVQRQALLHWAYDSRRL